MFVKQVGPSGLDSALQNHIFFNNVRLLKPASATTPTLFGFPNTAVGTISHPALAATSLKTSTARLIVTSATTANSASNLRSAQNIVWRGNAAGLGGFLYVSRFGIGSTTANQQIFVGLHSATTAISTTQVPTALVNILGICADSADTILRLCHNDGSGVATEIDLGSDFPHSTTTAFFELVLFCPPQCSSIGYRVKRLDAAGEVSGSLSTDIPAANQFLTRQEYMNNGGTAAAVILEIFSVGIETDY
jgi:hypothetical protein